MSIHEKIISGQTVTVVRNRVRGPLAILFHDNAPDIAAQIHNSDNGYWYERIFKSHRAAVVFFDSLPEGKSPGEMLAASSTVAESLQILNRAIARSSIEQVACDLGVATSTVYAWRAGRRTPSKPAQRLIHGLT